MLPILEFVETRYIAFLHSTYKAARRSLESILKWDFERVILAHGDLIETDAKAVLRKAWAVPLQVN